MGHGLWGVGCGGKGDGGPEGDWRGGTGVGPEVLEFCLQAQDQSISARSSGSGPVASRWQSDQHQWQLQQANVQH